MDQIIAQKNSRAYAVDVIKILAGSLLSVIIIAIILIFRKSIAFVQGKYSLFDFNLLFLILTVGLIVNGAKALKNHKDMPKIMLSYENEKLVILGEEIDKTKIKALSGKFEFGKTGTIIIKTEGKEYNLFGVKEYALVINKVVTRLQKDGVPKI